jgi:hypothetical protein
MRRRFLAAGIAFAGCTVAPAQVEVKTVLETYFLASEDAGGFAHALSWGEMNVRFNPQWKATLSFTRMPTRETYDELCLSFEPKGGQLFRVGRIRTAFGFSDWSELYYNGFNHRPLVRSQPLVDGLRLNRDDAGVEATFGGPKLQIQTAILDPEVTAYQVGPTHLRAGTVRAQTEVGDALIAFNALSYFGDDRLIYGLDARWTTARIQVRIEAFAGAGGQFNGSGYNLDGAYRLPGLPRTQLVARTESMELRTGAIQVHTFGVRHLLTETIGFNLNYGWIEGRNPGNLGNRAPERWSLQATYRVSF